MDIVSGEYSAHVRPAHSRTDVVVLRNPVARIHARDALTRMKFWPALQDGADVCKSSPPTVSEHVHISSYLVYVVELMGPLLEDTMLVRLSGSLWPSKA